MTNPSRATDECPVCHYRATDTPLHHGPHAHDCAYAKSRPIMVCQSCGHTEPGHWQVKDSGERQCTCGGCTYWLPVPAGDQRAAGTAGMRELERAWWAALGFDLGRIERAEREIAAGNYMLACDFFAELRSKVQRAQADKEFR